MSARRVLLVCATCLPSRTVSRLLLGDMVDGHVQENFPKLLK